MKHRAMKRRYWPAVVTIVLVAAAGGTTALARGSSGQDAKALIKAASPAAGGAVADVARHGRVRPDRKRKLSPRPSASSRERSRSSVSRSRGRTVTSPALSPTATSPALSPTATSSALSPTATSPAPSPTESGAQCVTSSDNGSCGPYKYPGITASNGNTTYVVQDVWNAISGASQTLTSYNPGDWNVSADMPASNTAVVSYPDVEQNYTTTSNTPDPLSAFASMTSDFTESMPSGEDNEAAYDIWTGDAATGNYAEEIMIWVDDHRTTTPLGTDTGTATFGGQTFQIWDSAGKGQKGTISFLLQGNETSGTVDLLSMLNYLAGNGWIPADSGLNQVDFGWEICSTGGQRETFTMSRYDITSSCSAGASCSG